MIAFRGWVANDAGACRYALWVWISVLAALGCGGAAGEPDVGAASGGDPDVAITNGNLEQGNADGVVVAAVDTSRDGYWECSAVMLNPNWMLTAKHCVDAPHSSSVTIYAKAQPNPWNTPELWPRTENSSVVYKHPTEDAALVYFANANSKYVLNYSNPIHQGADADLVGKAVTCFGYGLDNAGLRSASFAVSKTGYSSSLLTGDGYKAHGFFMPMTSAGQVLSYGDSGGPCFVTVGGARFIAGIAHKVELDSAGNPTGGWEAGAQYFRDWVYSTTGTVGGSVCSAKSASVEPARTTAVVRWTTSGLAMGDAQYSLDGYQWARPQCKLMGISIPCSVFPNVSHSTTFMGLQPGTTYRYRAGGECFPYVNKGVKVLAPVRVYTSGSFTTLP